MAIQRLNIFQTQQRHWDQLHPYNAAQILQLNGRGDASRLTEAFHHTLSDLNLGSISVAGKMFVHERPGQSPEVVEVKDQSLEDYLSAEMNKPFSQTGGCPFRPFLLNDNDHHYAGIIYHHWVADSASIRLLMREWFLRIYRLQPLITKPLASPQGGYWKYFGPAAARWDLVTQVFRGVSWQSRMKRVCRIESPRFQDFRIRVSIHSLPNGSINDIRKVARESSATVNDLFLAEIARLCRKHVPIHANTKRQELALGTIVDLRAQSSHQLGNAFGLFLGFSSVVLRPEILEDSVRLLREITLQCKTEKRIHVAEASMLRMLAGVVSMRVLNLNPKKVIDFYRKRVPLAGGISNVNLNGEWPVQHHPDPLQRYIRISPTGPMMPVVFTPTTLGQTCHFGLTVREALIPNNRAREIARDFVEGMQRIVANRK